MPIQFEPSVALTRSIKRSGRPHSQAQVGGSCPVIYEGARLVKSSPASWSEVAAAAFTNVRVAESIYSIEG
jgi:hypothetical protein